MLQHVIASEGPLSDRMRLPDSSARIIDEAAAAPNAASCTVGDEAAQPADTRNNRGKRSCLS